MQRIVRTFLTIMLLGTMTLPSLAGPPYNVDNPSTTELKHFDLLLGYSSSQNADGESQTFPGISLSYGLKDNLELGLDFGLTSNRGAGAARLAGFGDMTPAIRWRFQEETKHRPQLLLGYALKIPTADRARGLGTGAVDHTLWLSAGKSYKRWQVYGNLGYVLPGSHEASSNLFYGMVVTYQLTETLQFGGQVYGNSPAAPGTNDELAWGFGLSYNYSPDKTLMFQVGKSERGYSDLNVFAGIQFTFK